MTARMEDLKLIEMFEAIAAHRVVFRPTLHLVHLAHLIELARAGVAARAAAALDAGDFS